MKPHSLLPVFDVQLCNHLFIVKTTTKKPSLAKLRQNNGFRFSYIGQHAKLLRNKWFLHVLQLLWIRHFGLFQFGIASEIINSLDMWQDCFYSQYLTTFWLVLIVFNEFISNIYLILYFLHTYFLNCAVPSWPRIHPFWTVLHYYIFD